MAYRQNSYGIQETKHSSEETVPKMVEVDKSTQGIIEEQMFYNRKTLRDITEMRHGNPGSQEFMFTSKVTIDREQTSNDSPIKKDQAHCYQ
ncbi:hypothetical protein E2562_033974 [Oryza meyeriana var. granulata]|uniref:Uncharacterized protein n=1 Tax=Oryza meyeriana var. granulata TaxID=110450 RepID=A0A6G1C0Y2_9ORYZ|nr:hypothetical protein E2562_033974 [Oryza meyeriana var. granulata]